MRKFLVRVTFTVDANYGIETRSDASRAVRQFMEDKHDYPASEVVELVTVTVEEPAEEAGLPEGPLGDMLRSMRSVIPPNTHPV